MTRIRLVVIGRVEELALAPALSQIFPEASFSTVKKDAGTTSRLAAPEGQARAQFRNFVDEMLAAGDVERHPLTSLQSGGVLRNIL